jgi:hypothetical protein
MKNKLTKYLKGTSKVLNELSKEIDKFGIDEKSLDLMKTIGSDLLFKGCSIDFISELKNER